jgi:glycerol kinase
VEELQKQWLVNATFTPAMPTEKVTGLLKGWQRAVKASIAWADDK